ncbi:MAG: matrixin family metalloprotease, partial [Alphaproteobacteria bacterium]
MAGTASAVKTPDTGNKWLDSIMWGKQWTSGAAEGEATEVTYYIAGTGGEEKVTLDQGSVTAFVPYAEETQAMRSAMDAMAAVANITFVSTTSQATTDLIWGSVNNTDGQDSLGWANPPGVAYSSTYQDHQSGIAINRTKYNPDSGDANFLVAGGYDYITFIHELGHALGLAHPHDKGGGSLIAPGVKGEGSRGNHDLSQGIYTMMSYNDGWETGPVQPDANKTYGYEKGPMAFDIAALQIMYGANMAYHAADDSYALPTANVAGTGYLCLWDAGGQDEILGGDFGNMIDLRAATLRTAKGGGGWVSYADGIAGGFTIANGVVIEDATGGAGRILDHHAVG